MGASSAVSKGEDVASIPSIPEQDHEEGEGEEHPGGEGDVPKRRVRRPRAARATATAIDPAMLSQLAQAQQGAAEVTKAESPLPPAPEPVQEQEAPRTDEAPVKPQKLEDFEALCAGLEVAPDARSLARLIGRLQESEEELEAVRLSQSSQKAALAQMQEELSVLKEENERAKREMEEKHDQEKDEEIAALKEKLRMMESSALTSSTAKEGVLPEEEQKIIEAAERELAMMDELIRESSALLEDFEMEMSQFALPEAEATAVEAEADATETK